jgi:vesicle-fusing ATPase
VVVDDIELLVDWNPIGPRFSNFVLSALKSLLKRKPPKERRRMVFATTSERSVLQQLQLLQFFDGQIPVPNVNTEHELLYILGNAYGFGEEIAWDIVRNIQQNTGRQEVGVSIKRILTALNKAKEKRENVADNFIELMSQAIMEREG